MELATGRADYVLTGGVDAFNDIFMFTCFTKTPALSPTGNARPFDASGDGTVLGEGLGMIVLSVSTMPGATATACWPSCAASAPRATAKATPSTPRRKRPDRRAARRLRRRKRRPRDDRTRRGARHRDAPRRRRRGRCPRRGLQRHGARPVVCRRLDQSQIGHTKAAAGIAGLLKATAALANKVIPPTIKVTKPLDLLQQPGGPFYVATEKRPWMPSADHPRRAAVTRLRLRGQ